MKSLIPYTLAASMVAGAAASLHGHHQHHHRHVKGASPVEKRNPDVVTEYVAGPTATVWELAGELLDAQQAKQGLEDGKYVVIGETTPTYTPPPAKPSTTQDMGAEFFESVTTSSTTSTSTSSTSTTTSTTSTRTTSTTSSPPPPSTTTSAAATTTAQTTTASGGTGINADFPSGQISCSQFPSDYGAVPISWLDQDGWSSIQQVPDYVPGAAAISDIIGGVAGSSCEPNSFCSYACPDGYQKTQWPSSQGATGQSIGGLYCNSDGYLELSRTSSTQLCEAGMGGVVIKNELSNQVATCRTDYPGSEAMVIPALANAGATIPLTNPDQDTYFQWEGKPTSAQYYVNNQGCSEEECCVWTSSSDSNSRGNWAPVIVGVGMDSDGTTFLSVFGNTPTSDATLDFNIEISGEGLSQTCTWTKGSPASSQGCTTGMSQGGSAVIRYYD